jgi:uncharacterized membrane protein
MDPPSAVDDNPDAQALARRIQFLTVEHWGLLSARSMTWNESFTRAGMFLSLVTGSVVALALVAQATDFGEGFTLFAALILPVVLFVGAATFVRLVQSNNEDGRWVQGLNRLRAAYLEMDPGLKPYLVTGWTEDWAGLMRTFGARPGATPNPLHGFVTTPAMVAIVNAMLAAVLGGLLVYNANQDQLWAAVVGAIVFVLTMVVSFSFAIRNAVGFFAQMHRDIPE